MPEQKQTPDTRDAAQEAQQAALTIVRDVYAGTLRLREKGRKYLPQMERETDKDYKKRLAVARLFNAYRRTVGGLVGLVMAKDPQLSDDLPPQIIEDAENIDMAGRHLAVFARDHFTDAFDGHACILVDMPNVEEGAAKTLDDERALAGRPYWVAIRKEQILRVRTINVGGRVVLSRFAYKLSVHEDDGEFGQKEVEMVRDYMLATVKVGEGPNEQQVVRPVYRAWSKRKNKAGQDEWKQEDVGNPVMSIPRIPVATTYTHRTGYMESEPPLFDLAEENLNHYQVRSDRSNVLRVASVPILALSGVKKGDVEIGPHSVLHLPVGGEANWVEIDGKALEESRQELREIERRMAVLGLSLLMSETNNAETATSKRIDKGESDSQLSAAARGLQDALENAIGLHAMWLGLELERKGDDRWVTVNREFEALPMDAQTVAALSNLVAMGQLPLEEMWTMLQRGKLLPDNFDAEKAKTMLDGGDIQPPLPRAA